jgi:hypothetical protein
VSSGPFTVPAGARQRVPVRLTRHGMRVARRAGWFLVDAEIPDGRIGPGGRGSSELTETARSLAGEKEQRQRLRCGRDVRR